MNLKKAGCKKQGHCYSKRDKARLPVLFLNNIDPVFCNLLFSAYFGLGECADIGTFSNHRYVHKPYWG